jgi:hypothetical protein
MLRKIRQFGPKNAAPGPDRMRTAVNRDAIYRRRGKSLSSASSSAFIRGIPTISFIRQIR